MTMGTDIHSVAQVRRNGRWETVRQRVADDDRNYDTFSVYANVRNGYGFAGVLTGQGWRAISEPRGLPYDFEAPEDEQYPGDELYMGDHSFSWLLLSEIAAEWERLKDSVYVAQGVVDFDHYAETLAHGKPPKEYCGDVSGSRIVKISEADLRAGKKGTHVMAAWEVPASDRLRLMQKQLAALEEVRAEYDVPADRVRLVFGFDS